MATMDLQFAPNLSMLFTEVPFLDRFEAAARAGFRTVEFLFPYDAGIENVSAAARRAGVTIALFDVPPGDREAGEIGFLGNPGREREFMASLQTALEAAVQLHCHRLNVLAGTRDPGSNRAQQVACAVENLVWGVPRAVEAGVTLLVEALNPVDFPHYLVHSTVEALEIVGAVAHSQVKIQYDVYHAQMTEGNLLSTLTARLPDIGHIQIADVPGRHEPGTGEIRFAALFARLEALEYSGYVGLEYHPTTDTLSSLEWLAQLTQGTSRDAADGPIEV
jgi:hydroxypyruvate isomerase